MILRTPAKVNLHLKVLGKRPDGYHNIETLFEKIALYDKIILIIEGIDNFIEPSSNSLANPTEAIVAFWLPRFFPKNIRVICTVDKNSESYKYLLEKNCQILEVFF